MTNNATASAESKFLPDGTARPFPGNTVISPVSPDSTEARHVARAADLFRDAFALDFVFLPPTSWHMTVFELLCDKVRDADHWSRFLDPAVPLATTDGFFAEHVPSVMAPEQLVMRFRGVTIGDSAAGLLLEPNDSATTEALRRYRENLSVATGVRFPDHDAYRFHITMAYKLRPPSADTQQRIAGSVEHVHAELGNARFRLDRPVLTYFSDMTEFVVGARRDALH